MPNGSLNGPAPHGMAMRGCPWMRGQVRWSLSTNSRARLAQIEQLSATIAALFIGRPARFLYIAIRALVSIERKGRMTMRLQDKVALITGAGSGIGRESALLFAQAGAAVVVADLDMGGG